MERKNILWLTSWYPNKDDPFDGDFIQRHALAASRHHNISVLCVKASAHYNETIQVTKESLEETVVYFPAAGGVLGKLATQERWRRKFITALKNYIKQHGLPHLVHVHIPWKAGLMALYLKKKHSLPFIITEHWGIYNARVADNFRQRPYLVQQLTKKIFIHSRLLVSVSDYLGMAIRQMVVARDYIVVPNVVDDSLFRFSGHVGHDPFTFIHVSNMAELKQVRGIIDAFALLLRRMGNVAKLVLVGPDNGTYRQQAASLGLAPNNIIFKGEISYDKVGGEMQAGHCFVLNSLIENAPCVISEALCCGLPVIATNVGGIPEMVDEANGMLIPPGDTKHLAAAMKTVMEQYDRYNQAQIAARALQRYGTAAIEANFKNLYDSNP